jgi:hypothetical protein
MSRPFTLRPFTLRPFTSRPFTSRPSWAWALAASLLAPSGSALAGQVVEVTVRGTVEFNLINSGPLAPVADLEHATLRFRVDSDVFLNSAMFPTRGYVIDQASFSLAFDSAAVTLKSPFPAGSTPYFVLRDNDPAVDGFFTSTNVNGPAGQALSVNGAFGAFASSFSVTYGGGELSSLDILGALGTYDFTGLSVFHWSVDDGPVEPIGMLFETLTIATVDSTWTDKGSALAGVAGNPKLAGTGSLAAGSANTLTLVRAKPASTAGLFLSLTGGAVPFKGGTLVPFPFLIAPVVLPTSGTGAIVLPFTMPAGVPAGTGLWMQYAIQDPAAVKGIALSNALLGVTP